MKWYNCNIISVRGCRITVSIQYREILIFPWRLCTRMCTVHNINWYLAATSSHKTSLSSSVRCRLFSYRVLVALEYPTVPRNMSVVIYIAQGETTHVNLWSPRDIDRSQATNQEINVWNFNYFTDKTVTLEAKYGQTYIYKRYYTI